LKKRTKKLLTHVEPGGAQAKGIVAPAATKLLPFFLSAARLNMAVFASFFQKRRPSF
jgi:hypothetical protein